MTKLLLSADGVFPAGIAEADGGVDHGQGIDRSRVCAALLSGEMII